MITIDNEEGAERRGGDHDDRDTTFLLLPKCQPDNVDSAVVELDACNPDDANDGHHEREAEEEGHTELLP